MQTLPHFTTKFTLGNCSTFKSAARPQSESYSTFCSVVTTVYFLLTAVSILTLHHHPLVLGVLKGEVGADFRNKTTLLHGSE